MDNIHLTKDCAMKFDHFLYPHRYHFLKMPPKQQLHFHDKQLKQLGFDISKLIESDGIVMTSEIEIADLIKSELGLSIKLNNKFIKDFVNKLKKEV